MKLIIDVPDEIYKWLCEQYANSTRNALSISFLDIVCNAVKKGMPYEERPQGEWIRHDPDETHTAVPIMECSCCHKTKPQDISPALFYAINQYCNWCGSKMIQGGADMRGEE